MANYETLKSAIQDVVKTNGNNEITGALLQQSLLAIINSLGSGYQFVGVAKPTTNPGTPDQRVFYIASEKGTYTNFSGITITEDEIALLIFDTSWHKTLTGIASNEKLSELEQDVTGIQNIDINTDNWASNVKIDNWGHYAETTTTRYYSYDDAVDVSAYVGKQINIVMGIHTTNVTYSFCDSTDKLISKATITESNSVTIPSNAKFFRLSALANNNDEIIESQEEVGASITISNLSLTQIREKIVQIEPELSNLKSGISNGSAFADDTIGLTKTTFYVKHNNYNYLDPDAIVDTKYVDLDGVERDNAILAHSGTINVSVGEIYSLQNTDAGIRDKTVMRFVTAYDANGNAVSASGTQNVKEYTIPSGVASIVISFYRDRIGKDLSVVKSSEVLPYEEYNIIFIDNKHIDKAEITQEITDTKLPVYSFNVIKAMCIGDSITAGVYDLTTDGHIKGIAIKENYPYFLGRISDWDIENKGVSGESPLTWWQHYTNPSSATPDVQELFSTIDFTADDFFIILLGSNTRVWVAPNQQLTYIDMNTGDSITITTTLHTAQIANNKLRLNNAYVATGWTYENGYIEDPNGVVYDGEVNDLTDTLETDVIGKESYEDFTNNATGCYCKIISKIIADNPNARIVLGTVYFGNVATNSAINSVIDKIAKLYPNNVIGVVDNDVNEVKQYMIGGSPHLSKVGYLHFAQHWFTNICKLIRANENMFERLTLA